LVYLLLFASIITSDIISKRIIRRNIPVGDKITLIDNRFYIKHLKNKGFSYNKMDDRPEIVKAVNLISCILGALCMVFIHIVNYASSVKFGFVMTFSGAFANLIDRIKNGSVTDFIHIKFKNAPIFNVADIFIVLGSLIVFVSSIFNNKN